MELSYNQLKQLGFTNIYVYPGGIFEWLCLQDIFGTELFKTKGQELNILKFKNKTNNFDKRKNKPKKKNNKKKLYLKI